MREITIHIILSCILIEVMFYLLIVIHFTFCLVGNLLYRHIKLDCPTLWNCVTFHLNISRKQPERSKDKENTETYVRSVSAGPGTKIAVVGITVELRSELFEFKKKSTKLSWIS